MDKHSIPRNATIKKGRNRGRERGVLLHDRLQDFAKDRSDLQRLLLAAKWLGNAGSHELEMTEEVLLDAFDFVSCALHLIYEDRMARTMERASEVIEAKGEP